MVYGSLQLAKSCLIANILYFRIFTGSEFDSNGLKRKISFSLEALSRKKAKIFLFEASSLGLAPDFSFTVSVC